MSRSIRTDAGKQRKLIRQLSKDPDPEIAAMAAAAGSWVNRGKPPSVWLASLLGSVGNTLPERVAAPRYSQLHHGSDWWRLLKHWTKWAHNDDL